MSLQSINPATGQLLKLYPEYSVKKCTVVLESVYQAYLSWQKTPFSVRALKLQRAANELKKRREEFARLMTLEMGKPISQGRSEIDKCALGCEYYVQHARKFLANEIIKSDAVRSYVAYRPLGVVLAVMPWNFPFWQVFRFAAPALMAGNAAVLKHASNVSGCSLAIEDVFRNAGFPKDLFRSILIKSDSIRSIIEHPAVAAITLTGSTPAGKSVASIAGSCLKKTVLELGGSDPYLILSDADLEKSIEICVNARLINSGQSCIAAKRFIFPRSLQKKVEDVFVQKMRLKKMGDPMLETTDVGPQAREDLRDELHQQVMQSIKMGAKLLLGGKSEGPGAYYSPTILTNVRKGMPAYDEELFGPVASLISVKDEREAIRTANDSSFGLGAAVFTRDKKRGEKIAAQELQAGSCFVNTNVKSDPRLPFGGIKHSGYGRELSSIGIREFVNIKTVYVAK